LFAVSKYSLDSKQAASASQFDRQSDRHGKSHILADTQDVAMGLAGVVAPKDGRALDVATGGGHTALWLARQGWKVTAGDIASRMLENAQKLCADAGLSIETRVFPAEQMPFADCTFDLVTVRVAPHHFSSPAKLVQETARVLKPGGHFLLIDGSVPDDDPESEEYLHRVEKCEVARPQSRPASVAKSLGRSYKRGGTPCSPSRTALVEATGPAMVFRDGGNLA
jgi:ubiquinone/menaquinone biosynthesis C-methylase UbiE